MRKLAAMLACLPAVLSAEDMTYVKQGAGPYLWDDESAWHSVSGDAQLGVLPTSSDDVTLYGEFPENAPLRIGSQCIAAAGALHIGAQNYGTEYSPFFMSIDDGASLSLHGDSQWGNKAGTNVVTVQENATVTFNGGLSVGAVIDNTVIVSNKGTVVFNDSFLLGRQSRGQGVFENFGTLEIKGSIRIANSWSGNGNPTSGRLVLHEGSTVSKELVSVSSGWNFVFVGQSGKGEMVVENRFELPNNDQIKVAAGNDENSNGSLIVSGNGAVTNKNDKNCGITIAAGRSSIGHLGVKDNGVAYVQGIQLSVGGGSNSVSSVSVSDSALLYVKGVGAEFASGMGAAGNVEVAGNGTVYSAGGMYFASGKDSRMNVNVAGNGHVNARNSVNLANSVGSLVNMTIADSGVLEIQNRFTVATNEQSSAIVRLDGGTLKLRARSQEDKDKPYIPQFVIGSSRSDAVFSGYGTVGYTTHNVSAETGREMYAHICGKIIADGGGNEQDLDPTKISVYNSVDEANATGEAGWYAENKGRLHFPHGKALVNGAVTIGDNASRTSPELVNAFRVTLAGAKDGHYVHAALYAADRSDLPGDLPMLRDDVALGVWRMGYASGGQYTSIPSEAQDFESADVTVRICTKSLKAGRKYYLRALRWNGTGWQEVSSAPVSACSPNGLVVFPGLKPYADGSCYNIGWVAIVAQKATGMMIKVK